MEKKVYKPMSEEDRRLGKIDAGKPLYILKM
jgi:hypothetical protein